MFQIQSGIQQVPFVSTFIIISNFSNILCPVFFSFYFTGVFIGISSLVGIFIIDGKIQFQIFFRKPDCTDSSSEFVVRINPFAGQAVFEETSVVLIKQSYRKSKMRRNPVIVCQ